MTERVTVYYKWSLLDKKLEHLAVRYCLLFLMAVCSSNIIRFTSIHKITEQNATRYIMSTIFILLLFTQKNTKQKKKVKKKKKTCLFTTFYLATQTNSHSFFFCSLIMQLRKSCNVENGGKVKMKDSVFPPR